MLQERFRRCVLDVPALKYRLNFLSACTKLFLYVFERSTTNVALLLEAPGKGYEFNSVQVLILQERFRRCVLDVPALKYRLNFLYSQCSTLLFIVLDTTPYVDAERWWERRDVDG
jgi:hypothetical protein